MTHPLVPALTAAQVLDESVGQEPSRKPLR
jgi:hypothetical protein